MTEASAPSTAHRNNIADIYPLSPMQEGILFHTVSSPGSGLYMPQTAIRLAGPVDGEALRAAWQSAVDRHPVLRSAFYWEERDQPFQVVFRHLPLSWTALDWSGAGEAEISERLADLLAANRARPFDLRRPPLLRMQWIRTGGERSILVACFHHIVLDGWSMKQLLNEALLLYLRETGASTAPLPAARPYSDYIGWLKRQDRAASLRFWQEYLAGISGPTRLLGGDSTANFERHRWKCPDGLRLGLKALCAKHAITLNTVLQGALGLFIARQTGRDDVVFGTTTSGRPGELAGVTSMVGLFINTLPVRVAIDPQAPLGAWLAALQDRQAATVAHDYLPLREIQGSGSSLFDTLLVVENLAAEADGGRHLPFRLEGSDFDERTHFPLTIWAMPRPDMLEFFVGYSRDTVGPSAIGTMMEAFANLLSDMAGSPAGTLGALLDRMPPALTAAGFATRADMPHGHAAPRTGAPGMAAPPTPTERLLIAAWTDVLKCGALDTRSNFFELGGHSLLAARVISRLRRELSIDIPVRSLFERPALCDLAAYIDALQEAARSKADHVEIEI